MPTTDNWLLRVRLTESSDIQHADYQQLPVLRSGSGKPDRSNFSKQAECTLINQNSWTVLSQVEQSETGVVTDQLQREDVEIISGTARFVETPAGDPNRVSSTSWTNISKREINISRCLCIACSAEINGIKYKW
jgi:hypothetical protein